VPWHAPIARVPLVQIHSDIGAALRTVLRYSHVFLSLFSMMNASVTVHDDLIKHWSGPNRILRSELAQNLRPYGDANRLQVT